MNKTREDEEMRLAREMFHMRKSIPFMGISYPVIISRWTTNNQLLIDRPNESKRTNFLNNSTRSFSKAIATKSSTSSVSHLIWVDMEMTGLNPEEDTILEMACLITDEHGNIIAEGPNLIIHQPIEKLNAMGEWCLDQHTKSGLFKASLESNISLEQAEDEMLKFVQRFTPKGKCPLAGNTVYMDKIFLLKYMQRFCEHLHYRILDVSSIKILAKNWYNLNPPQKKCIHRALDDIKESINELTYYQKTIFKPMEQKMNKTLLK